MKLASMAEVQPSLCNYPNPRAHWPKEAWGLAPISIWALKGATKYKRHDIVKSLDAELLALFEARFGSCSLSPGRTRSPTCDKLEFIRLMASPRHSENKFSLCAWLAHKLEFIRLMAAPRHSENKFSLCARLAHKLEFYLLSSFSFFSR